ncbi:MAG: hypothetical protein ACI8RD_007158 [Bacillariaceae sp.]|jgi:hypothetical protein
MYRSLLSRSSSLSLSSSRQRIWGSSSTAWLGGASQRVSVSTTPPTSNDDVAPWDAVEDYHTEEGEWHGCRRDFMAPIEIPTRGADTL